LHKHLRYRGRSIHCSIFNKNQITSSEDWLFWSFKSHLELFLFAGRNLQESLKTSRRQFRTVSNLINLLPADAGSSKTRELEFCTFFTYNKYVFLFHSSSICVLISFILLHIWNNLLHLWWKNFFNYSISAKLKICWNFTESKFFSKHTEKSLK